MNVWAAIPIPQAVAASAAEPRKLFLVLFSDVDMENSPNTQDFPLESALLESEVLDFVRQNAITVRVSPSSLEAAQFRQIYPLEGNPILAVLRQGSLKDNVSVENVNSENLAVRLNRSLVTDQVAMAPQIPVLPQQQPTPISEGTSPLSSTASGASTSTPPMKTEGERQAELAALREKIQQAAKQREAEEKEQEIQREKQRREQGKLLSEAAQTKSEMEAKALAEEIKRTKKEQEEALKKIREQIALDKENRRKEREQMRQNLDNAAAGSSSSSSSTPAVPRVNTSISNLAIRLTDGAVLRHSFPSSEALQKVKDYIDANRTDGDVPYTMMATFPFEQYSDNDMKRTLLDLGLVPSGTITLKQHRNTVTTANAGGAGVGLQAQLWWLIQWILQTGQGGAQFIRRFLGIASNNDDNRDNFSRINAASSSTERRPQLNTAHRSNNSGPRIARISDFAMEEGQAGENDGDRNNKKKKDDDQAFYNGNSTQFL